jgi:hypothetical protein
VEFGEWLCEEVLKYVPHRQWVFSIPEGETYASPSDQHG